MVRPRMAAAKFHRKNDSSRTLFLTWYTIWCSSWRPRNEPHDIPRLASRKSLLGGSYSHPRQGITLQDLVFAR
jgi:hypothetical protein